MDRKIQIDVENVFSRVTRSDERVDQILDKAFSYLVDGYRYMTPYKLGQWDGKKHLYTATRRLPSGLVPEATALLEKSDYDVVINDLRVRPDKGMKAWNLRGAEQREHQMEAIVAALEEGRGVIWHATGAGKTETMAAIIQMLNLKAVVMVNQTYIANQTRERFQQRLNKPVGIITGTKKIDGDIVCVTFQSLQSQFKQDQENQTTLLKKWLSKFDVMCLDEAHHSLARTYQQIINECPAYYRYGFSATPEKTQDKGARLHITGSTGPVLDRFTAGEGVEKGFLVKAHITFVKWHEDSPKDSWSKEDFEIDDRNFTYTGKKTYLDERTGKRLPLPTPELGLYDVGIVRNKVRNGVIIDSAAAMYDDGLTTLILVERIDHGLYLKKAIEKEIGAPVLFLQGANSQAERDEAKRRFASGSHRVLIATTIFDEGVDIPVIDGLILAAAGKAQHRVIQRLGRGQRPKEGKRGLTVVDLYDTHSRTLWRHTKERMKAYKSDTIAYEVTIEDLGNIP